MALKNIGDVARKLEACVAARSAIDSAVRVYKDAMILADQAANILTESEQVVKDAANAALAALEAKEKAVIALVEGEQELINSIMNARSIIKGNPLDTCLSAREFINNTAQKVDKLKSNATSAAELSSIADAALNTAHAAYTERLRIYEDMKSSVENAKSTILEVSRIIRS